MPTYLLTWNQAKWPWRELPRQVAQVRRGKKLKDQWSCGGTKRIVPGDRLFFMKQGKPPRGLFGCGWALSAPTPGEHWDPIRRKRGIPALYVELEFDSLLNPDSEPIIGVGALTSGALGDVHWRTQSSGIQVRPPANEELEVAWAAHLATIR